MKIEIRNRIEALGTELTPEMIQATQTIFAAGYPGVDAATRIERDLSYGPDERNRLDIFSREGLSGAPVLVFVHGGGFVMGDKKMPDLPFYDNVGDFAVRAGIVGVTLTYRLAPANVWPSGPEDMAAAVAWLRANIAKYGGDPDRIFLIGQSAGATHVASYVAHRRFHGSAGIGIAGALLISGIYDIAAAEPNPFQRAYFGDDRSSYAACSTVEGLIDGELPLLFSVSEFDPADFQKQAAALVADFASERGRYPRMIYLSGHNHISPVLSVGSPGDTLGPEILNFIAASSPAS